MSGRIRVPMERFARTARSFATAFIPAVKRGLVSGAARCIPIMHDAVRAARAVNTGLYLMSWQSSALNDGAHVYSVSPYAGVIENGRRPNSRMPPVQAIARWLQRARGMSRKEAESVAWGVAKSIAKKGTTGRKVMAGALPRMIAAVEEEVLRELEALGA